MTANVGSPCSPNMSSMSSDHNAPMHYSSNLEPLLLTCSFSVPHGGVILTVPHAGTSPNAWEPLPPDLRLRGLSEIPCPKGPVYHMMCRNLTLAVQVIKYVHSTQYSIHSPRPTRAAAENPGRPRSPLLEYGWHGQALLQEQGSVFD